jgi:hypothetical protein
MALGVRAKGPLLAVPSDEDIATIDTTTPCAQQGPFTRARARQLNYQELGT